MLVVCPVGARDHGGEGFDVFDVAVWQFLWFNDAGDAVLILFPLLLVFLFQLDARGDIVVGEGELIKLSRDIGVKVRPFGIIRTLA